MKISQIKKDIKGVFEQPVRKYYFGKVKHGVPYFYPWNYVGSILFFRIGMCPKYGRFTKKQFSVLEKNICLGIGWPIKIQKTNLGWKDKYDTPRFEWAPSFHIFFFGLQFCYFYTSPDKGDCSLYWEQIIYFLKYSNKDLKKAKESWPWTSEKTKKSTWSDEFIIEKIK